MAAESKERYHQCFSEGAGWNSEELFVRGIYRNKLLKTRQSHDGALRRAFGASARNYSGTTHWGKKAGWGLNFRLFNDSHLPHRGHRDIRGGSQTDWWFRGGANHKALGTGRRLC